MSVTDTGLLLHDFLDREQVARELGVTPRTVARWMNRPDGLPYHRIGGRVMFHVPSVRRWIEAQAVQPNPTRTPRPRRSA